jgi:hypothetical protein
MHNRFFARDATLAPFVKRLALMVTLMLSCMIAACAPSMTQRIKVTVTVEDNGTLYSGSAVQQWTCTETNNAMGGMAIGGCELKAEAIPIKIGEKGWAFMLLSSNERDGFNPEYYPGAIQAGRSKANPKRPWSVPFDKAPMFVRFRDLKDRMTVELVRPNAFSEAFGKGVALVSIKCEVTNDWLTRGNVKKQLPWLRELSYHKFDETILSDHDNILTQIGGENFNWGL